MLLTSCAHNPKTKTALGWKKIGSYPYLGANSVHRYEYPNGLKLLVLEDHSAPVFTYHTWFNVGSKDEQPGLTGLAHLFEHMMFKATKNYPDGHFDRTLERAGSEMTNAFTSRDYTAYVQSMPNEHLELLVKLESDRIVNLIVDDQALNKEREVVQNERRFRNENNPDGKLYESIFTLAFKKHSYRWPVIGYAEDLERAKSAECYEFYKRFYAPNNATIVVVGDVVPDDVAEVILKHYGHLTPTEIKRHKSPVEPPQIAERTQTLRQKIQVEKLVVGYHIPPVTHPDTAALGVLRSVLATGKSSRLHRKLVDAGIASEISVDDGESRDPGLMVFFVTLQKGRSAKRALKIIDQEIKAIQKSGVTQIEIDRAVAQNRFSLIDFQASLHYRAMFLGYYESIAGDFKKGVELVNSYKTIRSKDVSRMAMQYLQPTQRSVVYGVPQ
ncbi:MAG TPA: pitrilysin family protein [Oligoflexia bacterium]|nr:pitrilysin family protein [Oligoflexia bacterium]